MITDVVYTAIKERLLPATPVKVVDWFNYQPDKVERGIVPIDDFVLPTALVRFDPLRWRPLGMRKYQADAHIYIDIMQDAVDSLSSFGTATEVARARQAQDNVHAVAAALTGLCGENIGSFTMLLMEMDHAYTKVRVDTIAFATRLFADNDVREFERLDPGPNLLIQ